MFRTAPNPFVLAPMAGITDMPFRRLMKRLGAGVLVSEFVSAHAVASGAPKLKKYLSYHEDERPVGLQLFGGDADVLLRAAQVVQDRGFDFVDINLGCPVPKVTRKGGGSAWLCHLGDLGQMLGQLRQGLKIPLTIKIRTGWDQASINAHEVVRIAREEGVDGVAIHGRTRAQGYSGLANWDLIADVKKRTSLSIVGNGDIISGPLAAARWVDSGCDAVMIGRGALKNPWIFLEAVEAWNQMQSLGPEDRQALAQSVLESQQLPSGGAPGVPDYYIRRVKKLQPLPVSFTAQWTRIRADRDARALIELHLELLRDVYTEEKVKLNLRKFLAWYSAGYPGSSQFRKFLFTHEAMPDLIDRSLEFFESVKQLGTQADDIRETIPVLMSGHG
jgi:nifR3 family TIM-barrel protein